ncbi:MAG: ATP-binding protein [Actinomycetota bacterium]
MTETSRGGSTDWRSAGFLRPGEPVDVDNCEREPIHFARAVQPSGWMLVVDDDDRVVQWSSNLAEVIDPPEGPGQVTAAELLGRSAAEMERDDIARPTLVGDRSVEIRAHRSRSGAVVVEMVAVDPSDLGSPVLEVQRSIEHLRAAHDLTSLCQLAADSVRAILGFDRVWIYRFDPEFNGEVVAESMRAGLRPYVGLHFGSGDIPPQARALYAENRVRLIRDTTPASAQLVPPTLPDGAELDLSDATLRAVSPMHLDYLANLGVKASASLALVVDGRLWGLCSGHHYASSMRLDHQAESCARLLSEVLALQIAAIEAAVLAAERSQLDVLVDEILASVAGNDSVLDGIVEAPDALVALTDADGCAVRIGGRLRTVGRVPDDEAVEGVFDAIDRLASRQGAEPTFLVAADSVHEVLSIDPVPELPGVLALLLSRDAGNWIVWFRRPFIDTVRWGSVQDRTRSPTRLGPEGSFAEFERTVSGRSRPWTTAQLDAVRDLRSSLGVLVFQRTEQLSRSVVALEAANTELDRFAYEAAHDLKEPLRGIRNYVDIIEEELPPEVRASADITHSIAAARRLTTSMSSLVDGLLEYAAAGRSSLESRAVLLSSIIDEATEFVRATIEGRNAIVEVVENGPVLGDPSQLSALFGNLISNAVKYTPADRRPSIRIGVTALGDTDRGWSGWKSHHVDLPPPTIVEVCDNGIGIPVMDRARVFEVFRRLHSDSQYGEGSGVGLSIARRIAERHGGDVWVEDNEPVGSRFLVGLSSVVEPPVGRETPG